MSEWMRSLRFKSTIQFRKTEAINFLKFKKEVLSLILTLVKHISLSVIGLIFVFPFLWMVMGAFKTNNEIWQTPYRLFPAQWRWQAVFESFMAIDFSGYMFNSFFVAIVGTLLMLALAILFSYGIVFLKGKYTNLLFGLILMTYMLPGAVTYVPSYIVLARLGLLDTLSGLILSNAASVFAVFYLRQSFLKTSIDYIEAARIDGASHWHIIRHVVLPLNRSACYTLFVLTFIQQYNNYMWPSIMLSSQSKYLVSQGLRQFFIQEGAYGMNWSEVMLASTLVILPVLIVLILGQKQLISGISEDSGLK